MKYGLEIKFKTMELREAEGEVLSNAADFVNQFQDVGKLDREGFFVTTLDQKNRVIETYLVALGTLTATLVHPREVFKPAFMDSAAAIMLTHNHPSGDCNPSTEDKAITTRLLEVGKIMGIRILDHIIIGRNGEYLSFVDSGFMPQ